jgi:hypothetical protein
MTDTRWACCIPEQARLLPSRHGPAHGNTGVSHTTANIWSCSLKEPDITLMSPTLVMSALSLSPDGKSLTGIGNRRTA